MAERGAEAGQTGPDRPAGRQTDEDKTSGWTCRSPYLIGCLMAIMSPALLLPSLVSGIIRL